MRLRGEFFRLTGASRHEQRRTPEPREPAVPARLRHGHRGRHRAARAQRGHHPVHLAQEERAGLAARVPPAGLSALAHDDRADLAQRQVSEDRLPGHHLLLGAQAEEEAGVDGRGRSRTAPHVREAGRAAARAEGAGGRGGGRHLRQRLGHDHLQEASRRGGRHLLFDVGGGARSPRAGAQSSICASYQ